MLFDDEVRLTTSGIGHLLERVTAWLEENGIEPRPTHHTNLVLEEILANVAMHDSEGQVARVRVSIEPDVVRGDIVDRGRPFDPTTAPEPDVGAAIADRPIGGLGLFLVRRLSSTFSYERRADCNCTAFSISRRTASAADHTDPTGRKEGGEK